MTKQEYIERYATELRELSDVAMDEEFARRMADAHWTNNVEGGEPCDNPEQDARTEVSYWDE